MTYPDDDDGDTLREIAGGGSDMSKPMPVDFMVVFGDRAQAEKFAGLARAQGYAPAVEPEDDGWCCTCTKEMLATHAAVVAAQDSLAAAAEPLDGFLDGWSSFGNK